MNNNPIFIVGCDRSGTTLLRLMINSHPNIAIPSETDFVADIIDEKEKIGDLLVDENLELLCEKLFNINRYQYLNLKDEIVRKRMFSSDRTYTSVLAVPFEMFAEMNNKIRWGDKTTRYILYMLEINKLFPNAKFIHIIRDGRDVACSLKSMNWFYKDIVIIAKYWKQRVSKGRKDGETLGNDKYLEVFYERLVTGPQDVLKTICSFISEEYTPEMLKFQQSARKLEPEFENYSHKLLEHEVTSQQIGRWRNELTKRELIILESITGSLLDSLGYRRHLRAISFSEKVNTWYLYSVFKIKKIIKRLIRPSIKERDTL